MNLIPNEFNSNDVKRKKTIALVGHDNKKADLIEWVKWNSSILIEHEIFCTGTTGKLVQCALEEKHPESSINVHRLLSGPLGGDFQLGTQIVEGKIDLMIFLWDPTEPHPHDVDIKALLRVAVLYNVPFACNRSSADYLISSSLFTEDYLPKVADFSYYNNRTIPLVVDNLIEQNLEKVNE